MAGGAGQRAGGTDYRARVLRPPPRGERCARRAASTYRSGVEVLVWDDAEYRMHVMRAVSELARAARTHGGSGGFSRGRRVAAGERDRQPALAGAARARCGCRASDDGAERGGGGIGAHGARARERS